MNEEPHVTKVREALDAFLRGDVDTAFVNCAANAVWHVLNGPFAGDYSQDGYRRMLATSWAQHYGEPAVEVWGTRGVGDELVVTEVRETGTHPDGSPYDATGMMISRWIGGQLVEGWGLLSGPDADIPTPVIVAASV